jgi:glycerate dehydrogenase
LITPHISWAPKESRQRLMDIAVANLKGFLSGAVKNVVNKG